MTGITGQVGFEVMNELYRRGHTVIGSARRIPRGIEAQDRNFALMELEDEAQTKKTILEICPDAIIHCAAWTAVDAAENPENETAVYDANVLATRNIAEACESVGAKMLYLSTDYVFDGEGECLWSPEDKSFAPLNVYGKSKLDGEFEVTQHVRRFFIVRTSWVFGKNGKNFVRTMLNAGKTHDYVRVVSDQIGRPTYAHDLGRLLADMIETEKYGYYHASNEGAYISWYDFCLEIYHEAGINAKVIPVTTADYGGSKAKRPFNSRLDTSKLAQNGFTLLPEWKDALARFLREIGENT